MSAEEADKVAHDLMTLLADFGVVASLDVAEGQDMRLGLLHGLVKALGDIDSKIAGGPDLWHA